LADKVNGLAISTALTQSTTMSIICILRCESVSKGLYFAAPEA
jgi:hypothetical protein